MTKKLKVHLVNYEEALGINGILSKYANSMERELKKLGHKVAVSSYPDTKADINHHINYYSYQHKDGTKNTLQVTHITDDDKMFMLKKGMETADLGICFSKETEKQLKKVGVKKLATVLPAHDQLKRRPIVVSILTNVYPNGCKREWMFAELLKNIDKEKFVFLIMGKGWEQTLSPFAGTGFMAEYHKEFEPKEYKRILGLSDYCLYFGEDEGSMGILDAKAAGIPVIAPPAGFHVELGVEHPFRTQKELNAIFKSLTQTPVDDWTWENYAKQHVTLWEKLLS